MVIPHWVNLPSFFRLDGNYLATSCPSAPSYRHRHRHRRLDRCRRPAPSPAENKKGQVKKKTKTRTTATTTISSKHLFKEAGWRSNSNSDWLRRWIESKQVLLAVDVVANLVVFLFNFQVLVTAELVIATLNSAPTKGIQSLFVKCKSVQKPFKIPPLRRFLRKWCLCAWNSHEVFKWSLLHKFALA